MAEYADGEWSADGKNEWMDAHLRAAAERVLQGHMAQHSRRMSRSRVHSNYAMCALWGVIGLFNWTLFVTLGTWANGIMGALWLSAAVAIGTYTYLQREVRR